MTGNYTKAMLQAHPTCCLTETLIIGLNNKLKSLAINITRLFDLWSHLDLNQGPTDYESVALTN